MVFIRQSAEENTSEKDESAYDATNANHPEHDFYIFNIARNIAKLTHALT